MSRNVSDMVEDILTEWPVFYKLYITLLLVLQESDIQNSFD